MTIDEAMEEVPFDWRWYWCSGTCGCLGCVNRSGQIMAKGFTKEQWEEWVSRNPAPDVRGLLVTPQDK